MTRFHSWCMFLVCVINKYVLPKDNMHLQTSIQRQMQNIFILVIPSEPAKKCMRKTSCNGICCSNKSLLLKVSGSLSLSGKLNSWTPGHFLTSRCMVSHRHFHGFCLLNISMRCIWIKELPEQIIKCSILFLTTVLDVHECKNWWMWMDQSSDTSFNFQCSVA